MLTLFLQISTDIVENEEDDNIQWTITNYSGISTAIRRLRTEQPRTLVLDLPRDITITKDLQQLCEVVQKNFVGDLKLRFIRSYLTYEKCDRAIVTFPDYK